MKTAVFFLAVYGAAISLALLKIGGPFRWAMSRLDFLVFRNENGSYLKTLSQCPACLGFWIALGATQWYAPLGPGWLDRIMVATASTGLIWIIHVILTRLGQYDL